MSTAPPGTGLNTGLCRYRNIFGRPRTGFHRIRIPGTPTALGDYLVTILAAWGIAALLKTQVTYTTVILLSLAILFHTVFCVQIE